MTTNKLFWRFYARFCHQIPWIAGILIHIMFSSMSSKLDHRLWSIVADHIQQKMMPYFVMTLISNGEARKYMLKIQENLFNCFELFERFQKKMVFSLYQSFVRPLSLSKSLRSFAMTAQLLESSTT